MLRHTFSRMIAVNDIVLSFVMLNYKKELIPFQSASLLKLYILVSLDVHLLEQRLVRLKWEVT